MSTVEQKPAVTTEAGVVEPTPAPAGTLTTEQPAEPVVPTIEEPAKTEGEGEAVAPVEESKEEKKEEAKPVEPIYSGALGYKAPGLRNAFRFNKKYFWFGEEPVSTQGLSHYLRGEKAEVAHPTAAWSSQTGKGLLYFVKHADEKATPAGVLNLAEATDLTKDGMVAFHFKLHGGKHTFEAQTVPERNGWFVAVEKAIEEAKAAKETIVSSEGYKEELAKLNKPATLAANAAREGTPKKSTDASLKPEGEASTADAASPARAGSSSSSSSDEDKKRRKTKNKSRSVSRGKRSSLFGSFLGKKEKAEEKKEEKDEDREAKKAEETPAGEGSSSVAPVLPPMTETTKPFDEPKAEETVAPAVVPTTEEKKVETEKPKPAKRGSIFGTFVEKLKSPTTERKESDLVPAAPAKEPETTVEAPHVDGATPAAPLVPATDGATEVSKTEEAKPAASASTPHKEKQGFSFGKFLGGGKDKAKSPTTETAPELPKTEESGKTDETPATTEPVVPETVAEVPKEEKKEEEAPVGTTSTASATPAPKAKRGSIFGNLTGSVKKEKDGEASEKPQGLMGLFRNASKAGKPKKEKETTAAPASVEETAEPKEDKTEEPALEKKDETPAAPTATTEPESIGDVVPDAVTVGQAPKSTPQISSTA